MRMPPAPWISGSTMTAAISSCPSARVRSMWANMFRECSSQHMPSGRRKQSGLGTLMVSSSSDLVSVNSATSPTDIAAMVSPW